MTISHRQVVARVRWWRRVLRLENWAIEVDGESPSDADGAADCDAKPEYLLARLRFDRAALEGPGELDKAIVHELIHLSAWRLAHVAETLADGDKRLLEWIRMEEETLITTLERLVVHLKGGNG